MKLVIKNLKNGDLTHTLENVPSNTTIEDLAKMVQGKSVTSGELVWSFAKHNGERLAHVLPKSLNVTITNDEDSYQRNNLQINVNTPFVTFYNNLLAKIVAKKEVEIECKENVIQVDNVMMSFDNRVDGDYELKKTSDYGDTDTPYDAYFLPCDGLARLAVSLQINKTEFNAPLLYGVKCHLGSDIVSTTAVPYGKSIDVSKSTVSDIKFQFMAPMQVDFTVNHDDSGQVTLNSYSDSANSLGIDEGTMLQLQSVKFGTTPATLADYHLEGISEDLNIVGPRTLRLEIGSSPLLMTFDMVATCNTVDELKLLISKHFSVLPAFMDLELKQQMGKTLLKSGNSLASYPKLKHESTIILTVKNNAFAWLPAPLYEVMVHLVDVDTFKSIISGEIEIGSQVPDTQPDGSSHANGHSIPSSQVFNLDDEEEESATQAGNTKTLNKPSAKSDFDNESLTLDVDDLKGIDDLLMEYEKRESAKKPLDPQDMETQDIDMETDSQKNGKRKRTSSSVEEEDVSKMLDESDGSVPSSQPDSQKERDRKARLAERKAKEEKEKAKNAVAKERARKRKEDKNAIEDEGTESEDFGLDFDSTQSSEEKNDTEKEQNDKHTKTPAKGETKTPKPDAKTPAKTPATKIVDSDLEADTEEEEEPPKATQSKTPAKTGTKIPTKAKDKTPAKKADIEEEEEEEEESPAKVTSSKAKTPARLEKEKDKTPAKAEKSKTPAKKVDEKDEEDEPPKNEKTTKATPAKDKTPAKAPASKVEKSKSTKKVDEEEGEGKEEEETPQKEKTTKKTPAKEKEKTPDKVEKGKTPAKEDGEEKKSKSTKSAEKEDKKSSKEVPTDKKTTKDAEKDKKANKEKETETKTKGDKKHTKSKAKEEEEEEEAEGDDEFKVEKIIDCKLEAVGRKKVWKYKVHWQGFPESDRTYEIEDDLEECGYSLLIEQFWKNNKDADQLAARKKTNAAAKRKKPETSKESKDEASSKKAKTTTTKDKEDAKEQDEEIEEVIEGAPKKKPKKDEKVKEQPKEKTKEQAKETKENTKEKAQPKEKAPSKSKAKEEAKPEKTSKSAKKAKKEAPSDSEDDISARPDSRILKPSEYKTVLGVWGARTTPRSSSNGAFLEVQVESVEGETFYVPAKHMKLYNPGLLIDFYESRIKFVDQAKTGEDGVVGDL